MKIFKRVYYPIMAVAVVLMLVLGIVDSRVSMSGGNLTKTVTDAAYSYAETLAGEDAELTSMINRAAGIDERISSLTDDDGNDLVDYLKNGENKLPTMYVQETTVRQGSQVAGESEVVVGREVRNVIVAFPGNSEDAILLHVRTDSYPVGGATDVGVMGAMFVNIVQTMNDYDFEKGERPDNTIVFLFGDAGQEGDLGAAAFMNQFKGFDDVVSHIKAVGDFKANGTGGTLMVYGATDGNLNLVGKYSKLGGGVFSSSALPLLLKGSEKVDGGVFGDVNTLNFTNRGGFNRYATANDKVGGADGISKKLVCRQANAMNKFIKCFGTGSLSKVDSKSSAVYFSYLDVMTVYYPTTVAFVIAGIIIGLVIAIVILNLRNKAFPWGRVLSGALVQLITLLASALSLLVIYYLVALLLSGLGVIPFHSISSIRYAGAGLFVSAAILAVALAIVFYILLKRIFGLRAVDVVRGNTMLFALVAVVLSFAAPGVSYPFTCVAVFSLLAMLMTVIFKNKFKAKFSQDIERLFLYVWAIVFSLPIFIPLFYVAQTAFAAVSIVLIMTVAVGLAGFIAPFADYLKAPLDKLFVKLPQRTVRVEQTVTKQVEDRAKKGKFTEVQVKEVVKQKYPWHYKNRIGLSFVAVLSVIMIVLFCSFGTTFSSTAVNAPDYYNSVYDDSLVFVYENGDASLEVHDDIAYNYIRYAVGDLTWNEEKNAYVKDYTGSLGNIIPSASATEMTVDGKDVSFDLLDASYSSVTVKLTNASAVTTVTFNKGTDDEIEYTFLLQDEITFRMPYGSDNFTMTVDGSCTVNFEQHIYGNVQVRNNPASVITNLLGAENNDWDKVAEYYVGSDVYPAFAIGVVIRQSGSIA